VILSELRDTKKKFDIIKMNHQELVHKLLNHIDYGRLFKLMKSQIPLQNMKKTARDRGKIQPKKERVDYTEPRESSSNKKKIKGKLVTNSGFPIEKVEIENKKLVVTDKSDNRKLKRKTIKRTVIKTQEGEYPVVIEESLIYLVCDHDIVKDCKYDTATHSMDLNEFVEKFRKDPNNNMEFEFTPLPSPKNIKFDADYIKR